MSFQILLIASVDYKSANASNWIYYVQKRILHNIEFDTSMSSLAEINRRVNAHNNSHIFVVYEYDFI